MNETPERLDTQTLLGEIEWVRKLARRLVSDRHASEDVAQQVIVAALESPPRLHGSGSARPWLARVARNAVIRARRSAESRADREHDQARPERLESAADVVGRVQMHERLVQAVLDLDEPYRGAVALRYFEGLSAGEIAARCGVSPDAARKRVSRGLEKLRERLDGDFGDRGAWCVAIVNWLQGSSSGLGGGVLIAAGVAWMGMLKVVVGLVAMLTLPWFLLQPRADADAAIAEHVELASSPPSVVETQGALPVRQRVPSIDSTLAADVSAAESADALVLEWRHFGGDAVRGATVALMRQGKVLASSPVDEAGRVRFAPWSGALEAVLLGATPEPQWRKLMDGRGAHRFELPEGERLSGWVLVDGAEPVDELAVRLVSSDRPRAELPEALTKHLAQISGHPAGSQCLGPRGTFEFSGLEPGWRGRLAFPYGYPPEPDSPRELSAKSGMEVRLRQRTAIRGRVLEGASGVPLAHVHWTLEATFQVGLAEETATVHGRGATDGSFAAYLTAPDVREGLLTLVSSEGQLRRHFGFEPFDGSIDYYLGDVRLLPAYEVLLDVRDHAGAPISHAVATALLGGREVLASEAGSAPGQTVLSNVTSDLSVLRVTAVGYKPLELALPSGPSALPLEVRLTSAPSLEVQVAPAVRDGELFAHLEASEPLFEGGWDSRSENLLHGRPRWSAIDPRDGSGRWMIELPATGHLLLGNVRPGVSVDVEIQDSAGRVLARADGVVLGARRESLTFTLPEVPRTWIGRVVDVAGAPVAGASVSFRAPGAENGNARGLKSDAEGFFELPPIFGETVLLSSSKPGFADLWDQEHSLAPGPAVPTLVLEASVEVAVQVTDPDGRVLEVDDVQAFLGQRKLASAAASEVAFALGVGEISVREAGPPGVRHLTGLPSGELTLRVLAGGRAFEQSHDAAIPQAQVVLPAAGSLALKWSGEPEGAESLRFAIRPQSTVGEPILRVANREERARGELLFSVFFPGTYELQAEVAGAGTPAFAKCSEPLSLTVTEGNRTALSLELDGGEGLTQSLGGAADQ